MKVTDDTTHDEMIRREAKLLRSMVGRSRRRDRVLRLSRLRSSKPRSPDVRRVMAPAS